MAKIIGKDPEFVKTATCKNCASVIEYTPRDVKYPRYDKPFIECPNHDCGHRFDVEGFPREEEESEY